MDGNAIDFAGATPTDGQNQMPNSQIVQNERPFPRDDDAAALHADIGRDRVDRLRVGGQIAQPLPRRFTRNGIMGLLIVKHRVRLSSSAVGS